MKKHYLLIFFALIIFLNADAINVSPRNRLRVITRDTTSYGNNEKAGRYYHIRGFNMYCETYGKGQPLLMIHGNGGSIKSFENNIPYFAKHYQVIVADSRAQGKSVDNQDSLSFDMMADDEAALLDSLHLDSVDVIGWSDGGIVGLLLAMRHPDKVKKLASTGANLWPDSTALTPAIWKDEKTIYDQLKSKTLTTASDKNAWKIFLLDWQQPHITLDQLHNIHCPTLVISGDHDMIRLQHTLLIYKNIPRADLWVLPNSGHATLIEHKEEFNKQVDRFFSNPYQER